MSVTRTLTLWCDVEGCHVWTYGDDLEHRTAADLRHTAKTMGWTRAYLLDGKAEDRCPKHGPRS